MSDSPMPRDYFSRRLRELVDNPGAVRASSTINRIDFYGNAESWIVDTFQLSGRREVFLQRIGTDEPIRIVLPPDVTAAIDRQQSRAVHVVRKRAARSAVATKLAAGVDIAAPLRRARAARKRKAAAR